MSGFCEFFFSIPIMSIFWNNTAPSHLQHRACWLVSPCLPGCNAMPTRPKEVAPQEDFQLLIPRAYCGASPACHGWLEMDTWQFECDVKHWQRKVAMFSKGGHSFLEASWMGDNRVALHDAVDLRLRITGRGFSRSAAAMHRFDVTFLCRGVEKPAMVAVLPLVQTLPGEQLGRVCGLLLSPVCVLPNGPSYRPNGINRVQLHVGDCKALYLFLSLFLSLFLPLQCLLSYFSRF